MTPTIEPVEIEDATAIKVISPTDLPPTENAVEIAKLLNSIFRDPIGWLMTPNDAFGLRKPMDAIGTEREQILLLRLRSAAYGTFS